MIDTHLPGDPASVASMADWLLRTLRTGTDDAGEDVVRARQWSSRIWEGESGEAYRGFVRDVVRASDQASSDVLSTEDVFRQCATQMRRAQRTLESCRERALTGGLQVLSKSIVPPLPADNPGPRPTGKQPLRAVEHWNEQQAAFEEQQRKAALYRQLEREANEARREYDDWCEDTLGPAARKAGGASLSGKLLSGLGYAAEATMKFQLSYPAKKLSVEVAHLQKEALQARGELQGLKADRRSGDPRRRGPANKADLRQKHHTAKDIEELLRHHGRHTNPLRWLPWVNTAWGLYGVREDIANGESPGRSLTQYGSGMGLGAVVAFAPATVPTALTVASAVALGYAAYWGGGEAWDALPEGVREDIDAGLKKSWDKGKEIGGDVVKGAADGVKKIGSLIP